MRILFDQGTPVPLRAALTQHEVATAYESGWSQLKNGELLDAAERDGFDVFVTTDSRLHYQQNLTTRRIAIIASYRPASHVFNAQSATSKGRSLRARLEAIRK